MKINPRLQTSLSKAESQRRCLHTTNHCEQQTLSKLAKSGEVTRVRHGLYARTVIWQSLDPNERYLWTIRGLHNWHPEWIFAGISVISACEVEHPYWLHDDDKVFVATDKSSGAFSPKGIQYIHKQDLLQSRKSNLSITSVSEALCDCAARYQFHEVLPMFDSALRKHLVAADDIRRIGEQSHQASSKVARLLRYADSLSENGGESLCRGIMIEEGFGKPQLQHEFRIPDTDGKIRTYRVDMLYHPPGNGLVAIEFDGIDKYTNPTMTGQHTIRQVVHAEKERENLLLAKTPIRQIVRIDFKEALQRVPLVKKLTAAGISRMRLSGHQ
ncbi:hypothetical protein [Bifidobacterium sp. ESL0800]|uniref:hypothetical protein n=1 Tax=Bifidobacterium sp. ESL0800 TaxID=2983236 RepID=UPI0023FA204D|nr:hypothetical protein [Bifidobacterium sp. ESL0800]WEV75706.1 hypothetical protein OZX75_00375 [Bifidobacterium sp. ESL0800]